MEKDVYVEISGRVHVLPTVIIFVTTEHLG